MGEIIRGFEPLVEPGGVVPSRRLRDIFGGGALYVLQLLRDPARHFDFVEERLEELRNAVGLEGSIGKDPAADVRTLPVPFRPVTGERHRPFADAVALLTEEPFPDMPIQGPRTARWLCEAIMRTGQPPLAQHRCWLRDAEIPSGDRPRYEHEVLSRILELGVEYDQLHVSNPASFEVLARRLQLIEEARQERPTAPSYDSAEVYLGVGERKGARWWRPRSPATLRAGCATRAWCSRSGAKQRRRAAVPRDPRRGGPAAKGTGQPPGTAAAAI